MIPIILGILLQIDVVQSFAADWGSRFLSEKSGGEVSIGGVEIDFFSRAVLHEVYMGDDRGDTMIYVKDLTVNVDGINFFTGQISLGSVNLSKGGCFLYRDSSGMMNIQRFFSNLSSKDTTPSTMNFRLTAKELNLVDFDFKMLYHDAPKGIKGINYQDMNVRDIYLQAKRIEVLNYDVGFAMELLTCREKSGFYLQHLKSKTVRVNEKGLCFGGVSLLAPGSDVRCERVDMLYDSWYAYLDFIHKVSFDVEIEPSRVAYSTVSAFTPHPSDIRSALEFSGWFKGTIANMRGQIVQGHTSKTEIDATFAIVGLPKIEKTHFDIQVSSLHTVGRDVQDIYADLTGHSLGGGLEAILDRSGQISLAGSFAGLLSDFKTKATLSTNAGTLLGQLQLISTPHREGGEPWSVRFTGQTSTIGFDAGKVLAIKKLGSVVFDAGVDAVIDQSGLNLNTKALLSGAVWDGMTFSEVMMDGNFSGQKFTGEVESGDKNLNFSTRGEFDFSGKEPSYNFEMDLRQANLVALKLNRRDSVSTLSAKLQAHASGTNLDNANGWAVIDSILYINHIDTVRTGAVNMVSVNTPDSKVFRMSSDFADLELVGRNSYQDMFKYLGKTLSRYIPSISRVDQGMPKLDDDGEDGIWAGGASSSSFSSSGGALAGSGASNGLGVASVSGGSGGASGSVAGGRSNIQVLGGSATEQQQGDNGYYMLRVDVKRANNVAAIFMPGLRVARGTNLVFYFNPYLDQFNLNLNSDFIERKDLLIEKIALNSRNQKDSVSVFVTTDYLGVGGLDFPNFSIIGGIKNNVISLGAKFRDDQENSHGFMQTTSSLNLSAGGTPVFNVRLHPSVVVVSGNKWYVRGSRVVMDSLGISVSGFGVQDSLQRLLVDGVVGHSRADTLTVEVDNFDISPLSMFVSSLGYELSGRLSGKAKGVSLLKDAVLFSKLDFQGVELNGNKLGGASFMSQLDNTSRNLSMSLTTDQGAMPVVGSYNIARKHFDVRFNFDSINMVLLEPMLKGILSETSGAASADLRLTGSGSKPSLNGVVDVKRYSAQVDFTKARYDLAGRVTVKDNRFEINDFPLSDGRGGGGKLNAWMDSEYYKNIRFSVGATFNNMMCLNLTDKDNSLFYGKAFASGRFSVGGGVSSINMEIAATTDDNSSFILPLPEVASISEADFITFVNPSDTLSAERTITRRQRRAVEQLVAKSKVTSEMDIKIDLNVLPNTVAQIILDSQTGSMVEGRGQGKFMMRINPSLGIFTMSGPFEISRGIYRFVLPGLAVDKRFAISQGGSILWSGDPANPTINVDAVYKLKTSLAVLDETLGKNTVNVDCGINLTGNMLTPNIRLSITAPTASAEVQNQIANLLNTEESTTTQFVSLLLNRSFMPDFNNTNVGTMTGSLVGVTLSEFLSNQVSSLISSDKFNFRFGYRPGDTYNEGNEVNVEIGSELIQNVLSVEVGGNYNSSNSPTANSRNPFTGDANLTWTLNKAGTLKVKGFTRAIDRFDETQGLQESGVGVYFRQDFQSLADLKSRYRKWLESLKTQKAAKAQKALEAKNKPKKKKGAK